MIRSNDPSDYWRIDTGETQVIIDLHDGPEPTITPSENYSLTSPVTRETDPPNDEWPGYVERYRTLLAYGARAGQYDLHDYGNGVYGYTQTHDGAVPNDSLLVGLRPPTDAALARGGWFLVDSVENQSPNPEMPQLSMGLTFLARLAQQDTDPGYLDRSAVSAALEAPPL